MEVHKVTEWEKGPKDKRVKMVQACFTDETGHHTNHMTKVAWEEKLAEVTEDTSGSVEGEISKPCEAD
jgi:hypothetical protein